MQGTRALLVVSLASTPLDTCTVATQNEVFGAALAAAQPEPHQSLANVGALLSLRLSRPSHSPTQNEDLFGVALAAAQSELHQSLATLERSCCSNRSN